MQSYSYFKKLAKKSLQGNFIKCIIAFLFVSLLPTLVSTFGERFPEMGISFTVISAVVALIIIPGFKMGAIDYLFGIIRREPITIGSMFNGFKYIFKLIPVEIARLISFLPLIIASIVFINILPKETMQVLTEYMNNPENAELLTKITDAEYNIMAIMQFVWIFTGILAIYLNTHLSLCEYILCNEGVSGFKSVFRSIKLMKGHILYYIGFSFSFILWILAAIFTSGISLIILHPYQQASYIMFYMELSYKDAQGNDNINNEPTIKEETE